MEESPDLASAYRLKLKEAYDTDDKQSTKFSRLLGDDWRSRKTLLKTLCFECIDLFYEESGEQKL